MDLDPASPELMRVFYNRLYPFKSVFTWLQRSHVPGRFTQNREFAFTLKGEVYLRYQAFRTSDEFKKEVCRYNPTRFEIGPVYSAPPKDKKTVGKAFRPTERELVFDIDMTDYDPIRTCCSGTAMCGRCWAYIAAAVKVLDHAIRDQFGYKHLLWVYSGRRGIHLWVSDEEAFGLTDEERRAIISWLHVVAPNVDSAKHVHVRSGNFKSGFTPLPPSLQTAVMQLSPYFTHIVLEDQDCFGSEEGYKTLLKLIPDNKVVDALEAEWSADPTRSSDDKWKDFKTQIKKYPKDSTNRIALMAAMEEIILQYTYPRLDAEVSKHRNHLLKAPFCVHPKTGRVCVPVDPATVESFEPEKVPTVEMLLDELDALMTTGEAGENQADWERTSLKPYVEMLNKHNNALLNDEKVKEKAKALKTEKQEQRTLDW